MHIENLAKPRYGRHGVTHIVFSMEVPT